MDIISNFAQTKSKKEADKIVKEACLKNHKLFTNCGVYLQNEIEEKSAERDRAVADRVQEKEKSDKVIDELLKANQVKSGVDAETIKNNNEALNKVAQEISKQKQAASELSEREKQMADWILYSKEQINTKDHEIAELKAKLAEQSAQAGVQSQQTEIDKSDEVGDKVFNDDL